MAHPQTMFRQRGNSLVQLAWATSALGVFGATAGPTLLDMLDRGEYATLNHARSVMITTFDVARSGVDAKPGVRMQNGYVAADIASLQILVELQGYAIEEVADALRIYSPQRSYCFTYHAATRQAGSLVAPRFSTIAPVASGSCA